MPTCKKIPPAVYLDFYIQIRMYKQNSNRLFNDFICIQTIYAFSFKFKKFPNTILKLCHSFVVKESKSFDKKLPSFKNK